MRDFSTKTRKETSNQEVAGKHALHNVTSGHGQKLIQFAKINDIYVVYTKYVKRYIKVHG